MSLTYSGYLRLDELLSLQEPKSSPPEHDEMLFIIIHQAYELWFKEILHELDHVLAMLETNKLPDCMHSMKRILTILKVLVHQVDILETMTPLEFLSFRNYLENASGFQSFQFRELEFSLGQKNPKALTRFSADSTEYARLKKRFESPSLWDGFIRFLDRSGYNIPANYLMRDITLPPEQDSEIQSVINTIYHNDPQSAQFLELMVDLDEGIQEWRYRHVKMVERTIGSKTGTGGSSGVDYLKSTLFKPLFPDLWIVRAEFK